MYGRGGKGIFNALTRYNKPKRQVDGPIICQTSPSSPISSTPIVPSSLSPSPSTLDQALSEVIGKALRRLGTDEGDQLVTKVLTRIQEVLNLTVTPQYRPYFYSPEYTISGDQCCQKGNIVTLVVTLNQKLSRLILYPFGKEVRTSFSEILTEMTMNDKEGKVGVALARIDADETGVVTATFDRFYKLDSEGDRLLAELESFSLPIVFSSEFSLTC